MCVCVRYWPERILVPRARRFLARSCSECVLQLWNWPCFLWMKECFGLPSRYVNSSIGDKIYSDTLLTSKGKWSLLFPQPSMQSSAAVWATRKKYFKNPTFSGGMRGGRVWIVFFSEVTHLRTMSIQSCCRLLVVSTPPPPPHLKRPRSPHSSSVIKSKMAATTMQMPCWWAPIRAKLPGWYGCGYGCAHA